MRRPISLTAQTDADNRRLLKSYVKEKLRAALAGDAEASRALGAMVLVATLPVSTAGATP